MFMILLNEALWIICSKYFELESPKNVISLKIFSYRTDTDEFGYQKSKTFEFRGFKKYERSI